MPVVESIIRFIGLCLFSQSIPGDPGVHVLLPHVDPPAIASTERRITQLPPAGNGPVSSAAKLSTGVAISLNRHGIEAHMAGIAFPAASYDAANSTWTAKPLPNTSLLYVPLAGERVKFITTAANAFPSLALLDAPKLKGGSCCPSMATPSYQRAEAVIDISGGAIDDCGGAVAKGRSRIDTEWRLKHNASLIIRGTKGTVTKEVRITGAPTIVVFNIPARVLGGDFSDKPLTAMDGVPHQNAYYAMSSASCTASLEACMPLGVTPPPCRASGIAAIDSPPAMAGKTTIVDFQCSNSQWP